MIIIFLYFNFGILGWAAVNPDTLISKKKSYKKKRVFQYEETIQRKEK